MVLYLYFFLFKQKTAYEMRISDWSSDVCSSDLKGVRTIGLSRTVVGALWAAMPTAAKADGHGPARGKRLPWFIRRTARRPAPMFSHDAKASRMRDRAPDSLCVQPEFSARSPRRQEQPLHTELPNRFADRQSVA